MSSLVYGSLGSGVTLSSSLSVITLIVRYWSNETLNSWASFPSSVKWEGLRDTKDTSVTGLQKGLWEKVLKYAWSMTGTWKC